MNVMSVTGDSLSFQNLPSMDVSSTTPENTHAIGARDTFKHQNYCCNTETENITLNVVCVMMLFLQKIN